MPRTEDSQLFFSVAFTGRFSLASLLKALYGKGWHGGRRTEIFGRSTHIMFFSSVEGNGGLVIKCYSFTRIVQDMLPAWRSCGTCCSAICYPICYLPNPDSPGHYTTTIITIAITDLTDMMPMQSLSEPQTSTSALFSQTSYKRKQTHLRPICHALNMSFQTNICRITLTRFGAYTTACR